jgi:hypothetical protein
MDEHLTPLGVMRTFEIYEGTHGNRVTERCESKVLPFLSTNLKREIASALAAVPSRREK